MSKRMFPAAGSAKRLFCLLALCLAALSLSACMGAQTESEGGGAVSGGSNAQKLAYGITINMPSGWSVTNSLPIDAATRASLEARARGGERVMLLDMRRSVQGPQEMDARAGVFLVTSSGNFIPEQGLLKMTPADFEKMSQVMMQQDRESAAKNKSGIKVVECRASRENINGKNAVLVRRMIERPDGHKLRINNWSIYLPADIGIVIHMLGDPNAPGMDATLDAIARSIVIPQ